MMFAQANSEHCRHKIFNADWRIDGEPRRSSLFAMIRNTHDQSPAGVLSAYSDNAAVIEGPRGARFFADAGGGTSTAGSEEPVDILHQGRDPQPPDGDLAVPGRRDRLRRRNPRRGRDRARRKAEGGTGRLHGLEPAHPDFAQPWETDYGRPARIASALDIMLEGPIGAAAFNNEFGRPGILGYFRTFEQRVAGDAERRRARLSQADHDRGRPRQRAARARRKAAGARRRAARAARRAGDADRPRRRRGLVAGQRRRQRGARLRVGAARQSGDAAPRAAGNRRLLGARRGEPDPDDPRRRRRRAVERRARSRRAGRRRRIELARVPSDEPGMSPLEIWCNEAQERYVLALEAGATRRVHGDLPARALPVRRDRRGKRRRPARRRRRRTGERAVDMPIADLLGRPPRMRRSAARRRRRGDGFDARALDAPRRSAAPAATAGRRGQGVPGHDRRPHGRRDDQPRPAGGPLAGAGQRRRGHASRACAVHRRGHGDGRAARDRAARRAGFRPHGGRRGDHQHRRRGHRQLGDVKLSANWMAACGDPARTPTCTTPCARSASRCARRSASRYRSARTRCRCEPRWREDGRERRSSRRCRS